MTTPAKIDQGPYVARFREILKQLTYSELLDLHSRLCRGDQSEEPQNKEGHHE